MFCIHRRSAHREREAFGLRYPRPARGIFVRRPHRRRSDLGLDLVYSLKDQLLEVRQKRIPIIGICNGFQVLVNTGLLPGTGNLGSPTRFWTATGPRCREPLGDGSRAEGYGLRVDKRSRRLVLAIPVGHGEGRLLLPEKGGSQTVFRYGVFDRNRSLSIESRRLPAGRAGICDPSGIVLGLMPHPERAVYPWLGSEDGLAFSKRA